MIVHSFPLSGDCDPYIYASLPIAEFEKSDKGCWVMEHAIGDVTFTISPDYSNIGYRADIHARFNESDTTIYLLKYGNND